MLVYLCIDLNFKLKENREKYVNSGKMGDIFSDTLVEILRNF